MGTQGTGRKRSTKKERTTAEDDALDLIAREAEARLAAKRAARAEAREIRMKELERQQKELSDDDERMSVGSRGSVRQVEDRDYLEKGSRSASALTAATLTSLGGTSSRRGSGETAITVDAETSIREIKEIHELKDQIQDVETKYTQNLKEVKDALAEVEEKYRKAMVSNAQLDNEKTNLIYQVDTLKDSLMELEELLSESRREFEEKVKGYEREKHAHSVLQFQFNELKETLKQSEELLNKHGIVLGPDLNVNGDIGEAEVDGLPSGDSAPNLAQDSQTSPMEGNSMLGNTEKNQLRSSGKEEVEPEQHQEMLKEEAKENNLGFDTLSSVADVSTLKTSSEEQPTEKQQTFSPSEEVNIEQSVFSKDLNVDINDRPVTEAKDIIICSPELEEIVSAEENVPEKETLEGQDLGELSNPDLGEKETKSSSVNTQSGDNTEAFEEQENKQEAVEESKLKNTKPCHQQNIVDNAVKESLPNESAQVATTPEPQQELENAIEEENDEIEELSSKTHPQGATASGKKKKKRRRGKKKGGTHEDKNQQKDKTQKENSNTEKDVELATGDNGSTTECDIDSCATEAFKEAKMDQVENEQDRLETAAGDAAETVEPTESFSHEEKLSEPRMDHFTNEHTDHTLKTETVEEVEVVAPTETLAYIESPQQTRTDPSENEQDKKQPLEAKKVENVQSVTSPSEANLSTSDLIDSSATKAFKKLKMDQVKNEQGRQETEGVDAADTMEPTQSFSQKKDLSEPRMDHVTNDHTEQSLETETVEEVQVVAPTETLAHIETHQETRTDPSEDEQDKGQLLETEKVEKVDSVISPSEASLSTSDLTDTTNITESTVGLEKEFPSSLDNSKSGEVSNNGEVIHREPEIIHHVEDDAGSIDDIKPACTTSNPESSLETEIEAESHVPSNGDIAADELESTNNSQILSLKSLSDSELPSEPSVAIRDSAREPEEAAEPIKDPGIDTEQECYPPSHDDENSELKQDTTEKEKLEGKLREPEDLVGRYGSSQDEKSDSCDSAPLTKNTDLDTEESLLETVAQAEQLNKTESQTECVDQTDESNVEVSSETEEINTTTMSNTTDSPKEVTEIDAPIKQESAVAEDSQHENCENYQKSETPLCLLDEQLHESSKDKPECDDSSRPVQHDSNEEDCEDEEGQSFDFDDMDMEAAIATDISRNPEQEEADDTVEVMSDDGNNVSSAQCQNNSEPDEKTQEKAVERNDKQCTIEEGNQVDTLDKESDNSPQGNKNSFAHEATPEKEENVADEARHIIEEEKVMDDGELGVAQNMKEAASVPVDEGLDALKHEMQDEGLVLPNSEDQVASSKEPPQAGKDGKKNGKKGKGKSKEECKMS